ncbi:3-hydroxyacyl-acyl-carrier-protein dehydratase FabZ [Porphyridium purpureum]|uniref:3-hydroxyacyl-acyl-carrier-protein dehydratase FabZ n=1 Tax=Porphyridium purpureum TaxID=35688 RepID=A0A5J4ZAD2_PORPP|nr:3-hydroxyacyl-acyl-carrier-protein dehydratase FabZ [Porphyridium purpureum]|eukprot:POR4159..scf295_1
MSMAFVGCAASVRGTHRDVCERTAVPVCGSQGGVNVRASARAATRSRARTVAMCTAETEAKSEAPALSAQKVSSGEAGILETVYDTVQIMKILPHRYPFLLLDKVVHYVPGESAIGIKNVSMNEPQFTGHFPDRPIMPGVLQIEAMAQLGGIVMLQEPITDGKGEFFFAAVDNVKWRKPVLPGDTLVMEMTLKAFKKRFGIGKMSGKAMIEKTRTDASGKALYMPSECRSAADTLQLPFKNNQLRIHRRITYAPLLPCVTFFASEQLSRLINWRRLG